LLPTDGQQAATAGDGLVPGRGDDQGAELRIPPAKLQKSFEIVWIEATGLYFDGPVTPTPLEHGVDSQGAAWSCHPAVALLEAGFGLVPVIGAVSEAGPGAVGTHL